jgi:hypothetical protein
MIWDHLIVANSSDFQENATSEIFLPTIRFPDQGVTHLVQENRQRFVVVLTTSSYTKIAAGKIQRDPNWRMPWSNSHT